MKRQSIFVLPVFSIFVVFCCAAVQAQVSFFQPLPYSGKGAAFVANFNGKPDILAGDGTMNLGNGDGTFTLGTPVSGTVLAVADFNGDGKLDLLEQGTGTLLVLLGKGDGTFQTPVSTASGASLSQIVVTDLRGNGLSDVIGVFGNSLLVYLSKGDGTFAAQTSYSLGTISTGASVVISVGDFNGDKKQDVVVSMGDLTAGQELTFLGNGDGTLNPTPVSSNGVPYPGSVAVADFNGDGKLDMAVAQTFQGSSQTVDILVGQGNGGFSTLTTSIPPGYLSVGDLRGIGKQDLVVSAGGDDVYLGNGDGTFVNASNYVNSGGIIADINLDGKMDLVSIDGVLLGNGDGTFHSNVAGIVNAFGYWGSGTVLGKFENNGATGAATLGLGTNSGTTLYILHNNGTGLLFQSQTYTIPNVGTTPLLTADLRGDGNLDLIVGGTNGYSVLLGNGDGTFQSPLYSNIGDITFMVVADVNNDQKPDLIVQTGSAGTPGQTLMVLLGNGDGTFKSPVSYYDAGLGTLLVADFNGDGKPDIAASGQLTDSPAQTGILVGNGDGTFQNIVFPTSLNGFEASFTEDFNDDHKPDLLGQGSGGWQVALGNGDGTFTLLPSFTSAFACFTPGGIADFNGDGIQDLLGNFQCGSHSAGPPAIALGNGDGTFHSPINVPVPQSALPTFARTVGVIGDMNGDGLPDLVFPYPASDVPVYGAGLGVLINTTHPVQPDFTVSSASGSPTSQTISAGQKASFTLMLAPAGSFSGMVNLSCAITPVVSPAPTCALSSSSVNISGGTTQSVTVTVQTTASTSAGTLPDLRLPPGAGPLLWSLMIGMLGTAWLGMRRRRSLPAVAASVVVLAFVFVGGCGGGSNSLHTTPGTPSGTYTATVTATSGSLTHNTTLQVVVQ